MRFVNDDPPPMNERQSPREMRDAVNEVLQRRGAGVHIRGVEFTRQGNIAITPQDSDMTTRMLHHTHAIQEVLADGRYLEEVVFEEDKVGERFVVGGIPSGISGPGWSEHRSGAGENRAVIPRGGQEGTHGETAMLR
jgi:hypothetical protein